MRSVSPSGSEDPLSPRFRSSGRGALIEAPLWISRIAAPSEGRAIAAWSVRRLLATGAHDGQARATPMAGPAGRRGTVGASVPPRPGGRRPPPRSPPPAGDRGFTPPGSGHRPASRSITGASASTTSSPTIRRCPAPPAGAAGWCTSPPLSPPGPGRPPSGPPSSRPPSAGRWP